MEQASDADNRLKDQIRALRSGNRTTILDTLKQIRKDGDVSILPVLLEILIIQEDEGIIRGIAALLNDLKDPEAVPVLTGAIGDPEFREVLPLLVSACWQNGLSYSGQLETFIDVLIKGSFEAAVEAFTVIEENLSGLDQRQRHKLSQDLKSRNQDVEDERMPLFSELVRMINGSSKSNG